MCFLFISDLIEGRNLLWIESSQVPIAIRWRVLLQSYKNSVTHILGLQNTVADWLSRILSTISEVKCVTFLSSLSLAIFLAPVRQNKTSFVE